MKRLISVLALLLAAPLAFGQPPQVPRPPQAPPIRELPAELSPAKMVINVPAGSRVWIDGELKAQTGPRCVFDTPPLAESGTYEVKVSTRGVEAVRTVRVSPGVTTELAVGEERAASPRPFEDELRPLNKLTPRTAETAELVAVGDDDAVWPAGVPKPEGLIRFRSTPWTQRTVNRGQISAVSRSALLRKWQVPGGMDGVTGWRSDLWKVVPTQPLEWIGEIGLTNSSGAKQSEFSLQRMYPVGTRFFDVLSRDGKPFETRERRVVNGAFGRLWEEEVIQEDPDARPAGYAGLKVSCSSCHNQTGTGGYGEGLVPGGDTVMADELGWSLLQESRTAAAELRQTPSFEPQGRRRGRLLIFGRR